jgi:hypothetical protein
MLVELRKDVWDRRGPRIFKYEIMWECVELLPDEIKKVWCASSDRESLGSLVQVLENMRLALRRWSKQQFGAVTDELNKLRFELDEAKARPSASRADIRAISDRMDEVLYREEMMWLQCSRITWLKEGDRNTKYFHRQAKWRVRKNKIRGLRRVDGSWCDAPAEMQQLTVEFFEDLYTVDSAVSPAQVLHLIVPKVNSSMNDDLCKAFTEKEISDAMFQKGPLKAAGPDGFPMRFYQRHRDIVKSDVVKVVQKFFLDGCLPNGINDTAIVLIPKGNDPEELKNFRPISLCNVIYMLISKCMVNRLRSMLDEIISPEQSAFVPTRRITDNTLITFECVHAIQGNNGTRGDYCAYKLDLSKAYDRVDWGILKSVMEKLGFHRKFVQWIMTCVSTVRYSVRFNGTALRPFHPSRGLRQSDPLSPHLFLLVVDCLSVLMKNYERQGLISGIRVSRRAPSISHLLFADDSLLFFKLDAGQANQVRSPLTVFENGTSQKLSPAKCSILVREGADDNVVNLVKQVLGVERAEFDAKYLGLPMPYGRMQWGVFQSIEERYVKRMVDWKERTLSQVAREVLIKAITQALPTYAMSVFKLPFGLCDSLEKHTRAFWWGLKQGRCKVQWIPWKTLIKPKRYGGLGFGDMRFFNQALLAHQARRLLIYPNSLCARVLKSKYFLQGNLLDMAPAGEASVTWRAIEHGVKLLRYGAIKRIRDGESMRIWRDN